MRFKPIKGNVFFPGSKSDEVQSARKILQDSKVSFTEIPTNNELSGFPNEHPLLVVNGRPYYGIEKIKQVAMNIYAM